MKNLLPYLFLSILTITAAAQSPIILNANPEAVTAGSAISISGTDLDSVTGVSFGNTVLDLSYIVSNITNILVLSAPSLPAGLYDLVLTTPGGVSNAYTITILSPPFVETVPTVTGISPMTAEVDDYITISGMGYTTLSGIFLGTTAVETNLISYPSEGVVVVKVPVLASQGFYSLHIQNAKGNSSSVLYSISGLNIPYINTVVSSIAYAGQQITISGTNFTTVTGILFGSIVADMATFELLSDNEISIQVPTLIPGGHQIVIFTNRGESNAYSFSVLAISPSIFNIQPLFTRTGGEITITGSNLIGVSQIVFNNTISSTGFTLRSPSLITAIVPNGLTDGKITIVAAYGNAESTQELVVDKTTEIETIRSYGYMKVYPNPFCGRIYIQDTATEEIVNVRILDLMGKCIMEGKETSYDCIGVAPGVYLIEMTSKDNNKLIMKIIKN